MMVHNKRFISSHSALLYVVVVVIVLAPLSLVPFFVFRSVVSDAVEVAQAPVMKSKNDATNEQEKTTLHQRQLQYQKQQPPQIGLKCLSFENEMEDILSSTRQVYIAMPAKAAGSTMGVFVRDYCMKAYNLGPHGSDTNYFNSKQKLEYIKTHNDVFPSVLSSHTGHNWKDFNTMIDRVDDLTDDELLIYMHRPEIERLLSSIKDVAWKLCNPRITIRDFPPVKDRIHYQPDTETCIIEEDALFEIIHNHIYEIGINLQNAINFQFYNEIQKHAPKNLVIAHFKQTDEVMKAIAKYHCPEILDQLPIKVNVGSDKESKIHVQLKSDKSKIVSIMEWVEKKKHVLQLKHDWFDDYECQGNIREIEEKMFSSTQ